jgi:aryl-phospho-beta-D-glucosidase BglC (GH1 family)
MKRLSISPRSILAGFLLAMLQLTVSGADNPAPSDPWLPASPDKLPRWRGFNLLNLFMVQNQKPFAESDFQIIHDLGFNFVRVPMDYRIWIVGGDWSRINDQALEQVDQAVAFGEKYHVHVCLNFHRAPGYTVAQPPESRSVWTDPEAQRVCAMHWAAFARRYKGIPGERLSFDLFNEPANIDPKVYAAVVAKMAAAIRAEDPNRLIIADGLSYGNVPCPDLIPLHIAQATRGYNPMWLTHYHASWIHGSDSLPEPTWPRSRVLDSPFLYGPFKPELQSPLILTGSFPAGTQLKIVVGTVSSQARLVVRADDRVVLDKGFVSGPDSKEGEKVVYIPEYQCYQNVFNQTESVTLPQAATHLSLSNDEGDWLTLAKLTVQPTAASPVFSLDPSGDYGQKQRSLTFDASRPQQPWSPADSFDRAWLEREHVAPWKALEARGVGIIVGEWGCSNQTPHDVALHWMEDNLANFKEAGWGWALWNLTGSFGILDSDRKDVTYEDFRGHKLDRQMLDLLQRY